MSSNEESVFAEALEKTDPQERAAFLDRVCAGNPELRESVEALLTSYNVGDFLERPPVQQPTEGMTVAQPSEDAHETPSLDFLSAPEKPGSLGRLAHYEVLEIIGQGGMGIVLRAFDEKLQRVVAIKVMAPELAATSPPRKRFLREARSAAKVRHEHVVDIHAVEEQPIPYLVMEYVAGETLQQKLDRVGPLEPSEVLRLGQQIARGLAAAHERGLIHRDIKPSNILLEKGAEERVKITDFGLARAVADASLTQSGVIAGTPMYMSPEQTVGDTIDHRADLFSLGSVLYTMCSGRPPFRATTSMATLKRVAEDAPRPIREIIPEVPQWLCDIIAKLHAKKPDERFQSGREVADLLGRHQAHLEHPTLVPMPAPLSPPREVAAVAEAAPQTSPSTSGEKASAPSRQRRRRWAAAAGFLLLVIGGLSLTDATGVTDLRGTVVRIFTPDGVLVVETDDPGLKVTIEGDGGLVITGAGLEEIRLRPGSYKVHAERDGKKVTLERELVRIVTRGRETLRVKVEALPGPLVAKADGAFVLLGTKGIEVGKFGDLAEAVKKSTSGDTIEIHGNGPFFIDPLEFGPKALTIRAGSGYAPVIKPTPAAVKSDVAELFRTSSKVVLEGLELHHEGMPETSKGIHRGVVGSTTAPLYLSNCKLIVGRGKAAATTYGIATTCSSSGGQVRNCLIVAPDSGLYVWDVSGSPWTVENCLISSRAAVFLWPTETDLKAPKIKLKLRRSQLIGRQVVSMPGPGVVLAKMLRAKGAAPVAPAVIETEENITQTWRLFGVYGENPDFPDGLPVEEQRRFLPQLVRWRERGNIHDLGDEFLLNLEPHAKGLLKNLSEWNAYWDLKDTETKQGIVRLRGNPKDMFETNPEAITFDDFRLRPDSAGYQAGKDKKDLGADVDLVGPGAAYERWKKTPEYQQWLKETGQPKAITEPTKEPGAFVLLGGKGVAVRKFDTLAEAVPEAGDGDTIEIRGNGPFITDPIRPGAKALTIRAGAGYAPVIQASQGPVKDNAYLLWTEGRLVLEGLELHIPKDSDYLIHVGSSSAPLYLANCKLLVTRPPGKFAGTVAVDAVNPTRGQIRNCLAVAGNAIAFHENPRLQWTVDNCLIASGTAFYLPTTADNSPGTKLQLSRNTLVSFEVLAVAGPEGALADRLRKPDGKPVVPILIDSEANIFQAGRILNALCEEALGPALPKVIHWRERGNVYGGVDEPPILAGNPFLKDLTEWNRFWGLKDTGSVQGSVLLRTVLGGYPTEKIAKAVETITPDDFRLRPDSAGYQAGKDKKDLGADVDLVGPGAAYEKWKKTPEYQQWLKETGQLKAESPKAESNAFVVLGGKGLEVGKFDTLAEAVKKAASGDTIEIRGNGPFVTDPLETGLKALTIRAGAGYVPVIKPSPTAVKTDASLVSFQGALTLEGLELHHHGAPERSDRGLIRGLVSGTSGPLYLTNCKLIVNPGKPIHSFAICCLYPARVQVRNCLIVSPGYAVGIWNVPGTHGTLENCLIATDDALLLSPDEANSPGTKLRLSRNQFLCRHVLSVMGPGDELAKRLRDKTAAPIVPALIETDENVIQTWRTISVNSSSAKAPEGIPVEEQRRFIPQLIRWRERDSILETGDEFFLNLHAPSTGLVKGLAEWNTYWGLKGTGSVQGSVRLRGNPKDLLEKTPEDITPDDFRLRPDSAGYQAGKDKKDLGADVDLVGPGAAYERWKKTPEYLTWLKETGQLRAEQPKAELGAFVLLGGKGDAVRKCNTLAEAVAHAGDADTIEIRGHGPFVTHPVQFGKRALTIRAGAGYRPVLRWTKDAAEVKRELIHTDAPLVLEGLEFQWDPDSPNESGAAIEPGPAPHAANCRFDLPDGFLCVWTDRCNRCVLRNCEFPRPGTSALAGYHARGFRGEIDNCIVRGTAFDLHPIQEDVSLRMTRTTHVGLRVLGLVMEERPPPSSEPSRMPVRIEIHGSILASGHLLTTHQYKGLYMDGKPMSTKDLETLLRKTVSWRGERNLHALTGDAEADKIKFQMYAAADSGETWLHGPTDLASWRKFWESTETGSVEGTVRFQGSDSAKWPVGVVAKLAPADFRLRADSAGYQAGKDKKDLGADVDLVGPGPAYERWKKTPEYQQWLKDSGQVK